MGRRCDSQRVWLQVTVKANDRTGLTEDDVFLFGNLVGETGDSLDERRVDEIDRHRILASIMANNLIETTYLFDINRDGKGGSTGRRYCDRPFSPKRPTPWQNSMNRLDVNADGHVSPIDALEVINRLNTFGAGSLDTPQEFDTPPPYLDVNGDNFLSPIDALDVINFLNADDDDA
ncbi:MAG: dockerin type I domain-containing protein [Pirellulaceae bacterium]